MTGKALDPVRFPLRWRLAAFLLAVALAAAAAVLATEHRSAKPVFGHLSPVAAAGLAVATTGAFAFLAIAVAPSPWLRKIRLAAVDHRGCPDTPVLAWAARGALLIVTAVVLSRGILGASKLPPSPDEEHFVRLAQEISDAGGVAYMTSALLAGTWTESNRHPLFPLIVSIYPQRWFAIAVSGLAYLASVIVLYLLLRRLLGCAFHSLLGVCVAASSSGLVAGATSALADMLLALCVLSCWYLTLRARDESGADRLLLWAALAGAAFGCAFLAKATAILWCAPVLLSLARFRARHTLAVLLALGTATLVASPLLIRNTRLFGNPLYNFNQRFLFADTFEEGIRSEPRPLPVSAQDFIARHGWSGTVWRGAKGLAWELFVACRAAGPCGHGTLRIALGAVAVFCGAVGLLTYWSNRYSVWLSATIVFAWLSFGWYAPIAVSARFVLPAVALLAGLAPSGLTVLARATGARRPASSGPAMLLWCALTAVALLLAPARYLPRL